MFDKELVIDNLRTIKKVLETIIERKNVVASSDDFLHSSEGMMRLDAICMNLIALGEVTKGLDKITKGQFLPKYPEIYWSGVMRMRDKIAHHYFEIDTDVVFQTIEEDIPRMLQVITRILNDIEYPLTIYHNLTRKGFLKGGLFCIVLGVNVRNRTQKVRKRTPFYKYLKTLHTHNQQLNTLARFLLYK